MAGLGRKEWSPGDVLTAADVNGYLMDQSVMVFAGTAARASAIPTPSAGMVAYSTATQLQVYDGDDWVDVGGVGYGVATGGASTAISVGGTAYTLLTFTSSGTLTVTSPGLFDVMVVSGGGGSGNNYFSSAFHGGGGGGGVFISTLYLDANATLTVGAGGSSGNNGNPSRLVVSGKVDVFGLAGATGSMNNLQAPPSGACGGGGIGEPVTNAGGVGLAGGNGGDGVATRGQGAGGGGGSSPANGANGSGTAGGNGGAGFDASTFRGESAATTIYGGGGGGGGLSGGTGGTGGGGNRGSTGSVNTGGGGGGNTVQANASFAGGSGIILVRFKV